jgi:hypothetical protein
VSAVVHRVLRLGYDETAMSPTGHKSGSPDVLHGNDPLETLVKGEQLLERAKSISRQIVDACRRVAPDDTNPDGPALQPLDPPPENV